MNSIRRRRFRDRLYAEQNGCCWICGEEMLVGPEFFNHPKQASLDHVLPRSKGGTHSVSNLKLAHAICNLKRGAQA
jgi:5-methylcytosine-specific restriction endonuclease McrA